MSKIHEIDSLVKLFADWFDCVTSVLTYCWMGLCAVTNHHNRRKYSMGGIFLKSS